MTDLIRIPTVKARSIFSPHADTRFFFNKDTYVGIGIAVVLTGLSYLVAVLAGWIDLKTDVNFIELAAVFTSYWCTYLSVKQRRFNYILGVVSSAFYTILFIQSGLVASAVLNAYLVVTLAYGFIRWRSDAQARPVTRVKPFGWWGVYLLVTAAFYGAAFGLITLFGGTLGFWDAAILALNILAQFLLDNKKIETWGVWVLVNIVAIGVYATSGLPLASFQYVFFLLNAFYGFYSWYKTMPKIKAGTLKAGEIRADRISFDKIRADQIHVGPSQNEADRLTDTAHKY